MSPMPSGNSPAESGRGAGGGPILFLCYDNPFNNTAHSICLLTMVRRLLDYGGLGGAPLHLLALNCRPDDLDRYAARREQFTRHYCNSISVDCRTRNLPKGRLYATVLEFIRAGRATTRYVAENGISTVYAYGEGALFLLEGSGASGAKIIFDCRGDHLSEERARGVWQPLLPLYRRFYRRMLPRVHTCFISSSRIAELLTGYGYKGPFVTNTNYYDEAVFSLRPRPFDRAAPRFVYAGGCQPYQQLERMLDVFKAYTAICPGASLTLVLSAIDGRISPVIERSRIDRSRLTVHTAHDAAEVNGYLNGCDIAFMLRDAHPLNHYAFPTKFAEYLGAGLPVIGTPHVYDTARIISEQGLGVLTELPCPPETAAAVIDRFISDAPADIAEKCSGYAREHLSWQQNVGRISDEILAV